MQQTAGICAGSFRGGRHVAPRSSTTRTGVIRGTFRSLLTRATTTTTPPLATTFNLAKASAPPIRPGPGPGPSETAATPRPSSSAGSNGSSGSNGLGLGSAASAVGRAGAGNSSVAGAAANVDAASPSSSSAASRSSSPPGRNLGGPRGGGGVGAAGEVPRASLPGSSHPVPAPAMRTAAAAQLAAVSPAAAAAAAKRAAALPRMGGGDGVDGELVEFLQPSLYDATANSKYWETRPVAVVVRLLRIGVEFGSWAAAARVRALRLKDPAAVEAAAAESLKDVLVRLGPAFVKIGQALSSRPDVLPPAYIGALEALQDRIPPFDDVAAMRVLESELGGPLSSVFASMSASPVAAASLGQVYRGALRPELGGGEVAVKVQRPRVAQMIAQDVYILRILAGWLRTAQSFNTDLPALVDEWAGSLFRELNYVTEGDNARRFKELFSHLPQVYVPHIYSDYTTAKVLTMEWIEGERLRTAGTSAADAAAALPPPARTPSSSSSSSFSTSSSSPSSAASAASASSPPPPRPPLDPERMADLALVEVGVRCSLEQMLEEGFYHADPHPGNLLRTPDGRLAYLDFGMMGQIDERTRTALMTATLHLVNREYGRLAEDFVTLGLLPPGTDREAVLPELTGVFTEALKGGVSNLSFGTLSGNLGATMYKFKFRIPPYYTLLVRSLSVLEGIALAADPNYKVLGSAYPWIARRLLTDPSPDLRVALRQLLYDDEGRFRFDRLESLLRQAAKAAGRIKRPQLQPASAPATDGADGPAAGATAATTSGGGSGGGALRLVLSPEGEFVRGILLDEVAKGIDGGVRLTADAAVSAVRQGVSGLPAPALFALLPGAPLLAALLNRGSSPPPRVATAAAAAATAAAVLDPTAVQRSLVAALARLPTLADADDVTQVAGLTSLSNALADVSGIRLSAAAAPGGGGGGGGSSASELSDAVGQAAAAVQWMASQAAELPDEGRRELLQLPLQLGARVASRVTARTVRALVLGGWGGSSEGAAAAAGGSKAKAPPLDAAAAAAAATRALPPAS